MRLENSKFKEIIAKNKGTNEKWVEIVKEYVTTNNNAYGMSP